VKDTPGKSLAQRGWHPWVLALPVAALFAGFLWLALEARGGSFLAAWDGQVTDVLVGVRTPGWDGTFWFFSLLGNTPVMVALASLVVLLLVAWGARARAILMAGALLSAFGASSLAKALVHRARPPEAIALIAQPGSFSLPSGHAFLTLVFAGLLAFLAFRGIGAGHAGHSGRPSNARPWLLRVVVLIVATAVVALVGLSRVYLGVHWASDVLAGWCLGGAWLALVLGAFLAWERGSRPLRDKRPWRGRTRVTLAVVLVLAAAIAVFLSARVDPLLP
jgi:membrane-associated phospholipid phosphatase